MTEDELAEALRHRLAEGCERGELDGVLPGSRKAFLERLENASPDWLIAGHLRCSVCSRMTMPIEQAVRFAAHAKTADEWIKFLVGWQHQFSACRHDIDGPN